MLAFERLAGARGGRVLFEGLDLALAPGGAALVAGPNGAGKSTLLRIAAGLLAPAAGRVRRDGAIALLTETHALDPERRLADALGFWAGLDGGVPMLAAFGLEALAEVPVRLLSTGQRRRAGLARVAASGAPIWLLDEPTNGLDMQAVATLETTIGEHRAAGGIVLVASHSPLVLEEASRIALTAPDRPEGGEA